MKTMHAMLALTIMLFAAPASADDDAALRDLTNYREYSPMLSSSGQPSKAQLEAIRDAGFERVVFLALSDSEGSVPGEDVLVKKLGLEFAHIPVDWDNPRTGDFYMFAGLMNGGVKKKTLVHCQVNFRASTFSFLYRVLYDGVPVDEAKDDLNSVWIPNDIWRELIFEVLEDNGISPDCEACLWE